MKSFCWMFVVLASLLSPAASHASGGLSEVVLWGTSRMESWSPPGRSFYPEAKETASDGSTRYASIFRDAMSVAFDPSEPPVFSGPDGRSRTLSVMLSIAHSESGFRKDVDFGLGKYSRGDGGRSWCLMQIQLSGENPVTHRTQTRIVMDGDVWKYAYDGATGWGGEDLVQDRKKCFRAALHMVRVSFRACSYLPLPERLSVYTGGSCSYPDAREKSSVRMKKAISWLFRAPAPADDQAIIGFLSAPPGASGDLASAASPPSSVD